MDKLEELRQQRAAKVAEMEKIHATATEEDRDLTEEEQASYDAAKEDVAGLDKRIAREEELAGLKKKEDESAGSVARGGSIPRAGGPEAKREFESLGEFMHAACLKPNDPRLSFHEAHELHSEQSMDEGASGGFMVPQQFRSEIFMVEQQESIIRPRATVFEPGTPPDSAITIPALDQTGAAPNHIRGGVEVTWIGEGDTKPETDADFRQITLQPHEVAAHIKVTDKLLRNWQSAGSFLSDQLRKGIMAAEDLAFLTGNGTAKPLGVVPSDAAYDVNRTTSSQINSADIESMVSRAKMGGNLVWIASQSILPQLFALRNEIGSPATGDGARIWQPSLSEGMTNMLAGYPLIFNERSPSLGTKGDLALVDLSYYLIKDGSGPYIASDGGIVNFTQNKTLIKAFWNVDGRPWLTAPIKQENGYEVSPFVVLDVPSE